jgi:hypothetical protein
LPTATQAVLAPDVVVVFRKHGGIAGIDEALTIHADGTLDLLARRAPPQQARTPPADLDALRGLLASPDFAQLQPAYSAAGADLFVYEVTVPTVGSPRTIVTMDAAPTPPVLARTLAELGRLRALVR